MRSMSPIESTRLGTVIGGMQFSPGLAATLESSVQRKRPTEPAPVITQLVTALGTSISNLTTGLAQMKQQGSQAMMQMLPQLMGR